MDVVGDASSISANLNNVPVLNGSNFKKWKEHVMIVLGCMDLDYALREDRPTLLTSSGTADQKGSLEKWERSNRMKLMIMKHSIPDTIRGAIPEENDAKKFLTQIADRFAANEKVETSTILNKLVSMRYKEKGNIREYIMKMSNLVTRLKSFKLELSEDIFVHLALISLPAQFNQFKISYNTQKEKRTLNEFIAQCVQEEERLKQDVIESASLGITIKVIASIRKGNGAIRKETLGLHSVWSNINKIK
ncbi:uncharacterized protein LOC142526176 [Primulina tabacum]|uniref:uncharacterized protein LOC142526176 n=1 Tax=Primulina tabacum TaxID=48773 RepID=UPI003F5A9C8F